MEFTGERVIPGQVNADLWAEHFSRYAFAARYVRGARVLDIGCGTGYGTAHLATHANHADGIDLSQDTILHCRNQYIAPNLAFTRASATDLPFPDQHFDLITAFEVIEHLEAWRDMLKEARRVLRPGGLFLVSTPNRDYYNEARATSGPNPFHVHEFTYAEYRAALLEYFPHVTVLLQNPTTGYSFTPADCDVSAGEPMAMVESTVSDPAHAYFYVAICGLQEIATPSAYIYVPRSSNVLREREHHIQSLQQQYASLQEEYAALAAAHESLENHLIEKNKWAVVLDDELARARANLTNLQTEFETQNKWALTLERELSEARAYLTKLQAEFEDRTRWALALNEDLTATTARLADARQQIALVSASRWYRLGRKLDLGPNLNPSE